MAGADGVWVCTATMIDGFAWLPELLDGLRSYMAERGMRRIDELRGELLRSMASAREVTVRSGYAVVDHPSCSACGRCWRIGHCGAITHPDDVTEIDPERCAGCSTCVDLCPAGAISMVETRA